MFKVHSDGKIKLDAILTESAESSLKLRMLMRDYRNVTSTLSLKGVLLGGWAVELLCSGAKRQHHDSDIFLSGHYEPNAVIQLYNFGYRRRRSASVLVNPERDNVELFFKDGETAFIVDALIDPDKFLERALPLTIEYSDEGPLEPAEENAFIDDATDDGLGLKEMAFQDKRNVYMRAKITTKLEPYEVPRTLQLYVPEPYMLALMKARSYASRSSYSPTEARTKDLTDLSAVITHYYGGVDDFIKKEYPRLKESNLCFRKWLMRGMPSQDPRMEMRTRTSGEEISAKANTPKLEKCLESIGNDILIEIPELSVLVLSAYYSMFPGDVHDLLTKSVGRQSVSPLPWVYCWEKTKPAP